MPTQLTAPNVFLPQEVLDIIVEAVVIKTWPHGRTILPTIVELSTEPGSSPRYELHCRYEKEWRSELEYHEVHALQQTLPFLTLPPEIRILIYRAYYTSKLNMLVYEGRHSSPIHQPYMSPATVFFMNRERFFTPNLPWACKTINGEIVDMWKKIPIHLRVDYLEVPNALKLIRTQPHRSTLQDRIQKLTLVNFHTEQAWRTAFPEIIPLGAFSNLKLIKMQYIRINDQWRPESDVSSFRPFSGRLPEWKQPAPWKIMKRPFSVSRAEWRDDIGDIGIEQMLQEAQRNGHNDLEVELVVRSYVMVYAFSIGSDADDQVVTFKINSRKFRLMSRLQDRWLDRVFSIPDWV